MRLGSKPNDPGDMLGFVRLLTGVTLIMSSEDQAREKRRQDRIVGTLLIVGAVAMSLLSVAMAIVDRFSVLVTGGGLAVWAIMAILGVIVLRRGSEK